MLVSALRDEMWVNRESVERMSLEKWFRWLSEKKYIYIIADLRGGGSGVRFSNAQNIILTPMYTRHICSRWYTSEFGVVTNDI